MKNGRNTDGKFSDRNKGRPKGSRNKATIAIESLLEGQAEALTQTAIPARERRASSLRKSSGKFDLGNALISTLRRSIPRPLGPALRTSDTGDADKGFVVYSCGTPITIKAQDMPIQEIDTKFITACFFVILIHF